jgi:hypothetical protein
VYEFATAAVTKGPQEFNPQAFVVSQVSTLQVPGPGGDRLRVFGGCKGRIFSWPLSLVCRCTSSPLSLHTVLLL